MKIVYVISGGHLDHLKQIRKQNNELVYGRWSVSSLNPVMLTADSYIVDLGTYVGYADEIACYLADKCVDTLYFIKLSDTAIAGELENDVKIIFYQNSDLKTSHKEISKALISQTTQILSDQPVDIGKVMNYRAFKIEDFDNEVKRQKAIKRALAKLTKEEIELLGIKK